MYDLEHMGKEWLLMESAKGMALVIRGSTARLNVVTGRVQAASSQTVRRAQLRSSRRHCSGAGDQAKQNGSIGIWLPF